MQTIETEIVIEASPHTVWSILDDLPRYGEWNPILPVMTGRTTFGATVVGDLLIPELPRTPLTPTINRVVAAREFRWISVFPGDDGFSAEHIFELYPTGTGTRMVHREIFDGPASDGMAEAIHTLIKPAYEQFNRAIKSRAELFANGEPALHPALSQADSSPAPDYPETLRCLCAVDPIEVVVTAPIAHNHLCGCSKCWKPEGALLAQTAVVASDAIKISANADKLSAVDDSQAISRHACVACGAHMIGTVADPDHHFYGLAFVHPELLVDAALGKPEFAGFLSSLIETGTPAAMMQGVRAALARLGIASYDMFSPEIMDIISYHRVKMRGDAA